MLGCWLQCLFNAKNKKNKKIKKIIIIIIIINKHNTLN
jgi:hypothetical protein